jgi:ubiquinone/menaquinone biosynthesis C-methylase UbiE
MRLSERYVEKRLEWLKEEDLHRRPNKWLASLPQCARAHHVLDIACGMGYDSFAWARSGKQVVGLDRNYDLLRNAASLAAKQGLHVRFVVADATTFPFPDNYFDICYSENLFEHVPDWQKIVSEAYRVLAPGGVFFVRTSNRHSIRNCEIKHLHFYPWLPDSLKRPILQWVRTHKPEWIGYSEYPAVNWFTHPGLSQFLRESGFDSCEVFDLVQPELLSGSSKSFARIYALLRRHPLLRYFMYPLKETVEVFGVKQTAASDHA